MAKDAREIVTLECSVCKERNHHTEKRLKGQDVIKRIELKKYCPKCNKQTLHKETK
ncbi:MAG: 50S ribosomal protein L33 [bacterium ADurb.Bin212]|nr:MAG: 50S ribosomal protein L33 [bacterium ADurb.Bin212]